MKCTAGSAILAMVGLLSTTPSALGQAVALACEHMSGAYHGQVWSAVVDFSARTIRLEDGINSIGVVPAAIDDQFITFSQQPGRSGRINRITGQMQWSTQNGPWDTVFGQPGVICRQQSRIGG
jgi:hypothetical protein